LIVEHGAYIHNNVMTMGWHTCSLYCSLLRVELCLFWSVEKWASRKITQWRNRKFSQSDIFQFKIQCAKSLTCL
jgi:hypothetical protein